MVILPLTSWSLQTFQQNFTFQLKNSDFGGKNTRNTMLRGFCNETNLSITSTQGNLRLMSSSSNGLSELSSVFTTV